MTCAICRFNPRGPRGARPNVAVPLRSSLSFQSTRPARGATYLRYQFIQLYRVSIHAPRAGRDHLVKDNHARNAVSIHAPRAGRDFIDGGGGCSYSQFQSTRPARGATL